MKSIITKVLVILAIATVSQQAAAMCRNGMCSRRPVVVQPTITAPQPQQAARPAAPQPSAPVANESEAKKAARAQLRAVEAEMAKILSQPNGASKMDTMYWKTKLSNARKAFADVR